MSQKFWIHRVDANVIFQIDKTKIIASQKKKSVNINKINAGDRIFILTKRKNTLEFIGYTQVGELYQDPKKLYDYYSSRRKLKLKGIKYLTNPIPVKDLALKLDFIIDKEKYSNYFKSEYREISKEDFTEIWKISSFMKNYPPYLEEITLTFKEFMLSTIKSVYMFVKHYENHNQIEIKRFLKLIKKVLDEYGIKKSIEEIKDFYSRNALELGFRHIPSRDPDKFVPLYLSNGEKKNFAYISLE